MLTLVVCFLVFLLLVGFLMQLGLDYINAPEPDPEPKMHPNAPQLGKVGSFFVMSAFYLTLFSLIALLGFLARS